MVNDIAAIVVNYRTPRLTIECVESLMRSTVQPTILIIDNHSGDDSAAVLRERFARSPEVAIHARSVNDGYAGGNNFGLELAREQGARLAFVLNSDTVLAPDCLALLVAECDGSPRVALSCPRIFFGDEPDLLWFGGATFSLWTGRPVHVGLGRTAAYGWRERRALPYATGCALLLRLDACPAPVFESSLFSYAEDLDLSLRVREAGYDIRYVPDAIVWHFEGSSHAKVGGQSLRLYLNTRNLLRVNARHARWFHWPVLAPMLALNVVARFCAISIREGDPRACVAVLRGAWHAIVGGRHAIEHEATESRQAITTSDRTSGS
jgi:GT2 family glycosyltransferase